VIQFQPIFPSVSSFHVLPCASDFSHPYLFFELLTCRPV
jgi:hypothetical protein